MAGDQPFLTDLFGVLSPTPSVLAETHWIRHGLFQAFYPNGKLASEGSYHDGLEQGVWRDFHDNGQLAAEGLYQAGVKAGHWIFWTSDGSVEASAEG